MTFQGFRSLWQGTRDCGLPDEGVGELLDPVRCSADGKEFPGEGERIVVAAAGWEACVQTAQILDQCCRGLGRVGEQFTGFETGEHRARCGIEGHQFGNPDPMRLAVERFSRGYGPRRDAGAPAGAARRPGPGIQSVIPIAVAAAQVVGGTDLLEIPILAPELGALDAALPSIWSNPPCCKPRRDWARGSSAPEPGRESCEGVRYVRAAAARSRLTRPAARIRCHGGDPDTIRPRAQKRGTAGLTGRDAGWIRGGPARRHQPTRNCWKTRCHWRSPRAGRRRRASPTAFERFFHQLAFQQPAKKTMLRSVDGDALTADVSASRYSDHPDGGDRRPSSTANSGGTGLEGPAGRRAGSACTT